MLAALGSARSKAKDASAAASMSQMRAQAELFSDGDDYTGFCADTSGIGGAALLAATNDNLAANATCSADGTGFMIYGTLSNTDIYCADSTGFAGEVENTPTGSTCQ